jgi:hypothetical protein
MHISACATAENAAVAAFSHVLRGDCTNAQVVKPNGGDAFRFHWTSVGIAVWCPPEAYGRPKLPSVKLQRVK